jgi:hypothetical protein
MTNRLAKSDILRMVAPTDKAERQRFWIDRGNRILWGQEPTAKGDYLPVRPDLHWTCINGNYFIEPRQ